MARDSFLCADSGLRPGIVTAADAIDDASISPYLAPRSFALLARLLGAFGGLHPFGQRGAGFDPATLGLGIQCAMSAVRIHLVVTVWLLLTTLGLGRDLKVQTAVLAWSTHTGWIELRAESQHFRCTTVRELSRLAAEARIVAAPLPESATIADFQLALRQSGWTVHFGGRSGYEGTGTLFLRRVIDTTPAPRRLSCLRSSGTLACT